MYYLNKNTVIKLLPRYIFSTPVQSSGGLLSQVICKTSAVDEKDMYVLSIEVSSAVPQPTAPLYNHVV
jgi:hypothetical protein